LVDLARVQDEIAMQDEIAVRVRDLRIRGTVTDSKLVSGVNFTLRRGETLGIVGESGSGKTLTCAAVLGILPKQVQLSNGTVEIFGKNTATFGKQEWVDVRGNVIAAVFQDPGSYLNPSIRLGKQINEVLRVKKGLSRKQAKAETLRLLRAVHLRDPELVYDQYVHELSGGMLQRVVIAAAIAPGPKILIADEATTALDVTVQAEVLDLLTELKERDGLSLVVVSHDLAVVAQICDEVLVMRSGEIVESGPTAEVLHSPQHEYTKLLISEHERYGLDRIIESERLEVA
jgi:ABC-type dipeptide/oligopeptide/nickel transport system ATPase component